MAVSVSPQNRVDVSDLYVALFGRAPDGEGLGYWSNELASGKTLVQVADAMFNTAPARAFYPTFQTNSEIINSFYTNVLGRSADTQGAAYWTAELNKPTATPGSVITQLIAAVKNFAPSGKPADATSDAAGTASKTLFLNKESLALAYGLSNGSIEGATNALTGAANSINLTVAADVLNGTSGKDMFTANVLQNAMGSQVNSLGSGDKLNGGGGADTLTAKITAGAFINGSTSTSTSTVTVTGDRFQEESTTTITNAVVVGSSSMPIEAETKSIETVKLQAVEASLLGAGKNTQVYVNAKDMEDVTKMSSNRSDADLIIQNLTTKGLPSLKDQTLGMEYTGNADSNWGASDYTVYYDQDYLTTQPSINNASVDIRIMNQSAYDINTKTALGISPSSGAVGATFLSKFTFFIGAKEYSLEKYLGVTATSGSSPTIVLDSAAIEGNKLLTYANALDAIKAALIKLKADPINANDLLLKSVEAVFGGDFPADIPTNEAFEAIGPVRVGTKIILTVTGSKELKIGELLLSPVQQTDNKMNLFNQAGTTVGDSIAVPLIVNVALEKVGLAGDGGTFIAGSMNKTVDNIWGAKDTVVGTTISGIQQFDVTVFGDNTKSSSLAGMHSTNNNLKVVTVGTDKDLLGASFANLIIGNSNTPDVFEKTKPGNADVISVLKGIGGNVQFQGKSYEVDRPDLDNQFALKDVQTFNAAALKGNLELTAALTREVTAKYLNVIDNAANPALDNVEFKYTSGVGNDYINLYLDPANLAQPGTVSREDMSLVISTGLGNDEVLVSTAVFDQTGGSGSTNFYDNQHINANLKMVGGLATGQLQINTGVGSDIVRTLGFGDFAVNLGEGLDTAYLDNTGGRATWAVNATNDDVTSLLSFAPATAAPKIANLFLNVSFRGYDAKVPVGGSSGSVTGVSVNDLTINQAIKAAINNDLVLNKLLIAEDGPGRTLVITSLIDGKQLDGNAFSDVVLSLSTTALTTSQPGAFLLTPAQATALGFGVTTTSGFGATPTGRFDADLGTGDVASSATSDNLVVGGLGNDVLVLGTGSNSNDTVGYAGFGNGTDSIVNFDSTFTPAGAPTFASTSFETVTLVFTDSDGNPPAQTIIFDGVTVTLASPTLSIIPALDVASQFVNQYNAAAATNGWVATLGGASGTSGRERATLTAVASDADLVATQTYTVAGLTYTSTGVTTQAQLANAFANLVSGATTGAGGATGTYSGTLTGYDTGPVTSLNGGTSIVDFVSTVAGDVPNLADSGSGAAAATITVTSEGSAATATGRVVTLVRDIPGATPDVTSAMFTGNYFEKFPGTLPADDGNGNVTVITTTQGQDTVVTPATSSTYTVTYTAATTSVTPAGLLTITSITNEAVSDGALTLATKAAQLINVPAGFTAGPVVTATGGASHSVTFTATAPGEGTIPTDVSYGLGTSPADGVEGTFTSTAGVNAVTTPPVSTPGVLTVGAGSDILDFSSYTVKAVFVGATLVKGVTPILGETYIQMTETTANAGEYTMSQFTEAGAVDTLVGVVGIADFGATQTFTGGNFVI